MKLNIGVSFALIAAICNGSVGSISKMGFDTGTHFAAICFFRTLGAFLILSLCFFNKNFTNDVKKILPKYKELALCSFFGSFMLSFFSTYGFSLEKIPIISIMIYASGTVSVILGIVVLKEEVSLKKILAIILIFTGAILILNIDGISFQDDFGIMLAIIAGLGYAMFIFCWKKFKLPSNIASIWYLFFFSTFYMFAPYAFFGMPLPKLDALPYISLLVIFPAILGFYCTAVAIKYTEASKVQITETTDPLFSIIFAFILFNQLLEEYEIIGATMILIGLIIVAISFKRS